MHQFASRVGAAIFGNLISASVIGSGVVIGMNRREARKNVVLLTFFHEVGKEFADRDQRVMSTNACNNIAKAIERQYAWLQQPIYKQLQGPPIPS